MKADQPENPILVFFRLHKTGKTDSPPSVGLKSPKSRARAGLELWDLDEPEPHKSCQQAHFKPWFFTTIVSYLVFCLVKSNAKLTSKPKGKLAKIKVQARSSLPLSLVYCKPYFNLSPSLFQPYLIHLLWIILCQCRRQQKLFSLIMAFSFFGSERILKMLGTNMRIHLPLRFFSLFGRLGTQEMPTDPFFAIQTISKNDQNLLHQMVLLRQQLFEDQYFSQS